MSATATREQSMAALGVANRTRFARADLKRDLRTREVNLSEVLLAEIPDWLERMKVLELLLAVDQVGHRVATRWLSKIPVHPHREVSYLTMRERIALAEIAEEFQS